MFLNNGLLSALPATDQQRLRGSLDEIALPLGLSMEVDRLLDAPPTH